ncbi:uncharacterized protein LOC120176578 [Hibiscus syriacus]|uniref:uncharacterized protein LOC120176578 n=1 Tax=Hibiscus syriacus TaxID=106335 RepID=UPI001923BF2B|nr:uncharacterized protein LOC120176578 [Hibiscus syriacus]
MEIMSLKPSFARKLNHRGLSPMHIAVEKGQQEMALRLLEVEKDVVRVRGKNGETVFTTFAGRPKSPTSIASKEGLLSGSDEQTGRRRNTALHVAATKNQPQDNVNSLKYKWGKRIVKYDTKASSVIFHDMDNISGDDRNALLVILGLLLTATFQSAFSPPGGLYQGELDASLQGTSMMNRYSFLYFYIPAYIVFIVTFFLILGLLEPYPQG